jgi:hypothetical protein
MQRLKQSDPRPTHRRLFFTCVDTAALQTRLQASDMATFTVRLSKNGGTATAPIAAAPVQVDATNARGLFYVELAPADIDIGGPSALVISNTGGTKTMERREVPFFVEPAFFATVLSGLTLTSFTANRTESADHYWRDAYASVLTGACAGQVKKVGGYTGSSKMFSLASSAQFTTLLGAGDFIELINR